jgi:hypothetical protein
MNRAITILAAIVLFSAGPLYADYTVKDRGTWPASWPKELEGLRKQSRTLEGPLVPLLHYAISFTNREAGTAKPNDAPELPFLSDATSGRGSILNSTSRMAFW